MYGPYDQATGVILVPVLPRTGLQNAASLVKHLPTGGLGGSEEATPTWPSKGKKGGALKGPPESSEGLNRPAQSISSHLKVT